MRALILVIFTSLLLGCAHQSDWIRVDDPSLLPPAPEREFRALWVATVDNIDWPSRPGLTAAEQQAEAIQLLNLAAGLKLNAIVLQVRPAADAFYRSRHEPWSAYLTGQQGVSPGYDPLAFWIRESHARGLDLHAWVNPFRAWHPSTPGEPASNSVVFTQPEYLVTHGEYRWLDPGDERARAHSLRILRDIVQRYDVDGIHVDDYFYPYPIEGKPFDDERTYLEYRDTGGTLDRSDWRRFNIDRFVRDMYAEVKRIKPHVLVGVSPFGIWRPGHPEEIVGFDAYEGLAADARRWLREGWLDYVSPQLYWKIESEGQAFEPLLNWWTSQNTAQRHVWPGLYLTRIKENEGWAPEDITRQIEIIEAVGDASGFVLFSAIGLLENRQGINETLSYTLAEHALIPASPWLSQSPSAKPSLAFTTQDDAVHVRVSGLPSRAQGWLLWTKAGDAWEYQVIPTTMRSVELSAYRGVHPIRLVAVQSMQGGGRLSPPVVYSMLIPAETVPSSVLEGK